MRHGIFCLSLLLSSGNIGTLNASLPPAHAEEVLHVRRITELWRSGEHDLAKSQVRDFLNQYPSSAYTDSLMVLIGTQEWRQKNYAEALRVFKLIRSRTERSKVLEPRLDSLYHLKEFRELSHELTQHNLVPKETPLNKDRARHLFYWAEALRFEAEQSEDLRERKMRLQEALNSYEPLYETSLAAQAKLGTADILQSLGHPERAAQAYSDAAELLPERRNQLLLKAAQLEASVSPQRMAQTLHKLQGSQDSWPLFSHALALYEAKSYDEVIHLIEQHQKDLNAEQRPLVEYLLGNSYFRTGRYAETLHTLASHLDNPQSTGDEKLLLVLLATSAHHVGDIAKVVEYIDRLETRYPDASALPRMHYLEAQTFLRAGKQDKALKLFEKLASAHPSFPQIEQVWHAIARIHHAEKRWREAHHALEQLDIVQLKDPLRSAAARLAIHTAAQQVRAANTSEERDHLTRLLVTDLETLLHLDTPLEQEDQQQYRLQLASAQFELGDYKNSRLNLEQLLSEGATYIPEERVHMLLAYNHLKDGENRARFVASAEKALAINPDLVDADQLRLHLTTAYLAMANHSPASKPSDAGNESRAADHLYTVMQRGSQKIPNDRLLWLGNFDFERLNEAHPEVLPTPLSSTPDLALAQRSRETYTHLTLDEDLGASKKQESFLRLARLSAWLDDNEAVTAAVKGGLAIQTLNSASDLSRRGRLQLAQAALEAQSGKLKESLLSLETLMTGKHRQIDPHATDIASLLHARNQLQLLLSEGREAEAFQPVREELKSLQNNRCLSHEPVHLEAAWEGVHLDARLAPEMQTQALLLRNLKALKRDFARQDDIISRDYHAARKQFPAQEHLFQAYMMLFDARIAELQGLQVRDGSGRKDGKRHLQAARSLYRTLSEPQFTPNKYLHHEAQLGLERLSQQGV